MANLDSSVRLVALQFSFTNPEVIPACVKRLNHETLEERTERKSHSNGIMVIQPTENSSLLSFLVELVADGYELVDAFYKPRIDVNKGGKTYHMVRFLFAQKEFANPSEEFSKVRETIGFALWSICEIAMWRVRAFSNPFYQGGEEIEGQRALSINLEARNPLFRPDSQPVTVWQKDEKGNRVGDAPLPLRPKQELRIIDGTAKVVPIA